MPTIKKSLGELELKPAGARRFNLSMDDSNKAHVAEALAPLIINAAKTSGLNLSESDISGIKAQIAKGANISIAGKVGQVAQVSGSVAGSCSVDW